MIREDSYRMRIVKVIRIYSYKQIAQENKKKNSDLNIQSV